MFNPNPVDLILGTRKDRVEVKYLFPLERLDQLIAYIRPFMDIDAHAQREGGHGVYTVGSVYFDGPQMEYYWSHVEGYPHRRKVRVRAYGSGGQEVFYWEIKQKMFISSRKHRWKLDESFMDQLARCSDHHELYELCQSSRFVCPETNESLGRLMGFDVLKQRLRPVLFVKFTRMPFVAKFTGQIRLTVDFNIKASRTAYPLLWGTWQEPKLIMARETGVLELKLDGGIPLWLEDMLLAFDLRRCAFSKYRTAVDKLYQLE